MPYVNKFLVQILSPFMENLTFVNWDRFTCDEDELQVYGWIDRPQDSYKDFIVLSVSIKDQGISFITSSAEKDQKIKEIIMAAPTAGEAGPDLKCIRAEDHFDITNVIKLKK